MINFDGGSKLRQFFDWIVLPLALVNAVAAVALLVISANSARSIHANFKGSLNFYAAQVDNELRQLIDYLDRFALDEPEATKSDLIVRFDILWGRVYNTNTSETAGAFIELPGAQETMLKLQETLADIENDIEAVSRRDAQTIMGIKRKLRSLTPLTNELVIVARDDDISLRTQYLQEQVTLTHYVIGFISVTLLFFGVGTVSFASNRRRIQKLNSELEERISERTVELKAANDRLIFKIGEVEESRRLQQESSERLNQAARLVKLGYYVWDAIEDRCEFCSEQHAMSHGLTPTEYIAQASKLSGEMGLTDPEDREMVRQEYQKLRKGRIIEMEYWVSTPGGRRRLREIARPVVDERGAVVKEIGSTIDITDQYEIELQLIEAQRMDHIGKLSAGVAHDFNNLLAIIMGNAELLREVTEEDARSEMLEEIYQASLRGRDLTRSMLTFARRAPLSPSLLVINAVVHEMESLLRRSLPENISFETALTAAPWKILADRSMLESALLNLAINARDAMPNGGSLTIETANLVVEDSYIETRSESIEPGRYVMLAVSDTGVGIDKDTIQRIFDPFFTTKGPATNSGLGLSMVQGFLKQSGGTVRVYSEAGVGTTFKMFFPVAKTSKESLGHSFSSKDFLDDGLDDFKARVLLVEDDDRVRKTVEKTLVSQGLKVVSAPDSAAAEIAFRSQGSFDVLMTDIVMPGDLQGPELAKKLRSLQSDLPVIFLSGYPQEATVHGNGLRPEDIRLMKPIVSHELAVAVKKALKT